MRTTTETQLLTTRAATVILPKGGRHMDNGNGYTVCGFTYDASAHQDGNILREPRHLSCMYCARQATHPMNVER